MSRRYQIELTRVAEKSLTALPVEDQKRVASRIDSLAENPRPDGVKKLSGMENTYRLRVGDYRVLYEIRDSVLVVLVVNIDHRKDVYRKS